MGKNNVLRRDFLGMIATGAAALGMGSVAGHTAEARTFANLQGSTGADFETWLGRIQGKHKQVFDAPEPNHGFPLAWPRVFMTTNNEAGTPDADLGVVVILRHEAIPIAMESRLWEKYKFGEAFHIDDGATKAPSVRNPYWQPKPGELFFDDMALDQLQKRGALFGVCDMALTVYSMKMAEGMKADAAEVKKDWVSGILPGIQIVPSGVLAINRAQERGCTYCYAG